MAQVEEASHSGKSGWASRGGCWRCGQVPNVGLKPVLKEKGPSRQFKWLSVGSDLPVLSKMQGFFPWILKDQSGQVMSLLTPLNHIYILSLPATPIVQDLATARIQRRQKDSSAGEVGGVRKYSCCVLWGGKG